MVMKVTHCTKFSGLTSAFLPITASVIQGSAIGPSSFVVNAANLTPVTAGNSLAKYADDTSYTRTVVRECCKGDDQSQWRRANFDPPPPLNPITDPHQNLRR